MTSTESQIAENYERVRQQVTAACRRAGRAESEVTLVAVTKYAEMEWVQALLQLGAKDFGESRPQQLAERVPLLPNGIRWHLIGPLQRNKVRATLPLVSLIHSVESVRLLDRIDRIAAELERRPRVLLEVNVSGEETKHGFSPRALEDAWERMLAFEYVRIEGLMTMAPFSDDPEEARPVFAELRELRDRLTSRSSGTALRELSMGMSNDFTVAIEEGATLVRIGSSLFEGVG